MSPGPSQCLSLEGFYTTVKKRTGCSFLANIKIFHFAKKTQNCATFEAVKIFSKTLSMNFLSDINFLLLVPFPLQFIGTNVVAQV